MHSRNVIPQRSRPTRNVYRERVAEIVRGIKAEHKLSNRALAERISCSVETIENIDEEVSSLNAVTLLIIGHEFGRDWLNPVLNMIGAGSELPVEDVTDECPLVPTLAFAAKWAEATSPNSPGGIDVIDSEILGMESEAIAANRALNSFIARIGRIRAGWRKMTGRAAA